MGAFSATVGSIGKWWSYLSRQRESAAELQKNEVDKIESVHSLFVGSIDVTNFHVEKTFTATDDLPSMADFMTRVEQMDRESMVMESLKSVKLASKHASLYSDLITLASPQASWRLGILPAASIPKSRSC